MKKKIVSIILAGAMLMTGLLAGCSANVNVSDVEEAVEEVEDETEELTDQEKADEVAALIDAIYVQTRTETTDEDCIKAKEAWDNLTDEQKELVEGEYASPEYFGLDTGDASLDDPLNGDDIGENEILVVSFGTSFNDSRAQDIGGIEKAIAEAFPDWSVRRAFTAQIIINHVQARDGEFIDNIDQALQRAVDNGVKNIVLQPTHLMQGAEYDEMIEALANYADDFETAKVALPLLGEVGSDASVINEDKKVVAKSLVAETVADAGFESIETMDEAKTALVLLGHGTSHTAKVSYSQMQTQMNELGYENVFIGTVEGEPEETECENVIEAIHEAGYENVILRPLMVVAGDHANNDMAGEDEDSWASMFAASEYFTSVESQIAGLGRVEALQDLYVAHTQAAIDADFIIAEEDKEESSGELEDGKYLADFETDSSMFHVNDVMDGKGEITVENGEMTIHIILTSENIVNLYEGLAEDAKKDEDNWLQPTKVDITYEDGTTETVNAFDVKVPALEKEFDLALIGKKNKWYDHKVKVSNPEAAIVDKKAADSEEESESEAAEDERKVEVTLEGGSGKASITSPLTIKKVDGKSIAIIEWSSPNYDYMIVDGEKYLPVNTEGNSVFEIPVDEDVKSLEVIADTVAMSKPHEIEYVITFK